MTLRDLFNSETTLDFEGKSYRMRKPNQLEKGEFQCWLEQNAFDAIERRTYQSPAQQAEDRRLLNQDCAVGVYGYHGELANKSLRTREGLAKIVSIILRDQGVSYALAERIVEYHQKLIAFTIVSKNTSDPKVLALALEALGLPADHLNKVDATPSSPSATHPSTTTSGTSEVSTTTNSSDSSTWSEALAESPS